MSNSNLFQTTLTNGVRIVAETIPHVRSAAIGIWIGTGSRYEEPFEAGISHVLEHMLFKGTLTRNAKQIAEEIESLGGYLNAFTDKEMTCYYSRVLSEHLPIAVDVLCDMLVNSKLDPTDISCEVSVILEEIKRREDSPEDLVHDLFLETLWPSHTLGLPVIGTEDAVSTMDQAKLKDYMSRRYTSDQIVIAAAGNFDPTEFAEMVKERLSSIPSSESSLKSDIPTATSKIANVHKDVEQIHFCIGANGYSQHHEEKYTLAITDTILGATMSSRLFQEIREKRGLAYSIGSYSAAYTEGGYFAVYGGSSTTNYQQVLDLTLKEFERIKTEHLTLDEITKAKNHIRGALLLGMEGMSSRMMRLGKDSLYFDRIVPIDEILEKIDRVDSESVLEVANNVFQDEKLAVAAIGPFNSL